MAAARRLTIAKVEVRDVRGGELDGEGVEAGAKLNEAKGADDGECREGLRKHIGEGDAVGVDAVALGEFAATPKPFEVVLGVPASDKVIVGAVVGMGAAGHEESTRLTGPRHERKVIPLEPGAVFGAGGGAHAGPDGVCLAGEAEVVAGGSEPGKAVFGCVTVRFIDAGGGPV